jgi:serine/threonine protein kinase
VSSLAPGTRIGGYRIVRTLSEVGHFSLVYCARPLSGEGEVALKESFPAGAADRSRDGATLRVRKRDIFDWALERFEREARFLRQHRHPNVVHVLDAPIRQNGTSYMVMDLLVGGSLRQRIERRGRETEEQVRTWLEPVLSALESIEKTGTSHLDLSPDNILFRGTGEPVLVDFGSARIGGTAPTRGTRMITNSGYSAPEKLSKASSDIDARADVYSLAALINYAMTGRDPNPAEDRMLGTPGLTPRAAAGRQGSPAFLAAVDKGFAVAIADRYRGAAEFRRALSTRDGQRPPAAEMAAVTPDEDEAERRRRIGALALLLFAFFCILFLIVVMA